MVGGGGTVNSRKLKSGVFKKLASKPAKKLATIQIELALNTLFCISLGSVTPPWLVAAGR